VKITNSSNNHPEAIIRGWVRPLAAATGGSTTVGGTTVDPTNGITFVGAGGNTITIVNNGDGTATVTITGSGSIPAGTYELAIEGGQSVHQAPRRNRRGGDVRSDRWQRPHRDAERELHRSRWRRPSVRARRRLSSISRRTGRARGS